MTNQTTLEQFKELFEDDMQKDLNLRDYVQFDLESPVRKFIFKPNALRNMPDPEFNVDQFIFQCMRKAQEKRRLKDKKIRVVAEGDSWFNLPWLFGYPPAIANCFEDDEQFEMINIAFWGYTLEDILNPPEDDEKYMNVIRENSADFFLLSAGGNDLQLVLADTEKCYIHHYAPDRKPEEYLTSSGEEGIEKIQKGYNEILDEVTGEFPNLTVICHGYDYPRPNQEENPHIGYYLEQLNIPPKNMQEIINSVLDKLNGAIKSITDSYESVTFIDLRGVTKNHVWFDDMHPDKDGFIALSKKFKEAIKL